MMAKMFYTMEEAKSALGKSEEEIKQYSREGRLREFRDGPRLMFKADQVEQLKGELGGSAGAGLDQVDLGVSDSGGLIGLVDTTGASGTSITLSDADTGQSSRSGIKIKDDTALAADLGLSGSLGGVPSPGRPMGTGGSGSGTGLSGSVRGGSGAGINVFGTEELTPDNVDPGAQTAITSGIREQIDLQGVGSGSGLLDLTRESDDTSLGAVLDEITPAGRGGTGVFAPQDGGLGVSMPEEDMAPRMSGGPVIVEKPDPLAPAFGGAALAASVVLFFGIFVLTSAVLGTRPDAVVWFKTKDISIWVGAAMGFGLVLVCFVFGLIFGKVATSRR
jgi:hypothetical protein